jgi:hypothetical protein
MACREVAKCPAGTPSPLTPFLTSFRLVPSTQNLFILLAATTAAFYVLQQTASRLSSFRLVPFTQILFISLAATTTAFYMYFTCDNNNNNNNNNTLAPI